MNVMTGILAHLGATNGNVQSVVSRLAGQVREALDTENIFSQASKIDDLRLVDKDAKIMQFAMSQRQAAIYRAMEVAGLGRFEDVANLGLAESGPTSDAILVANALFNRRMKMVLDDFMVTPEERRDGQTGDGKLEEQIFNRIAQYSNPSSVSEGERIDYGKSESRIEDTDITSDVDTGPEAFVDTDIFTDELPNLEGDLSSVFANDVAELPTNNILFNAVTDILVATNPRVLSMTEQERDEFETRMLDEWTSDSFNHMTPVTAFQFNDNKHAPWLGSPLTFGVPSIGGVPLTRAQRNNRVSKLTGMVLGSFPLIESAPINDMTLRGLSRAAMQNEWSDDVQAPAKALFLAPSDNLIDYLDSVIPENWEPVRVKRLDGRYEYMLVAPKIRDRYQRNKEAYASLDAEVERLQDEIARLNQRKNELLDDSRLVETALGYAPQPMTTEGFSGVTTAQARASLIKDIEDKIAEARQAIKGYTKKASKLTRVVLNNAQIKFVTNYLASGFEQSTLENGTKEIDQLKADIRLKVKEVNRAHQDIVASQRLLRRAKEEDADRIQDGIDKIYADMNDAIASLNVQIETIKKLVEEEIRKSVSFIKNGKSKTQKLIHRHITDMIGVDGWKRFEDAAVKNALEGLNRKKLPSRELFDSKKASKVSSEIGALVIDVLHIPRIKAAIKIALSENVTNEAALKLSNEGASIFPTFDIDGQSLLVATKLKEAAGVFDPNVMKPTGQPSILASEDQRQTFQGVTQTKQEFRSKAEQREYLLAQYRAIASNDASVASKAIRQAIGDIIVEAVNNNYSKEKVDNAIEKLLNLQLDNVERNMIAFVQSANPEMLRDSGVTMNAADVSELKLIDDTLKTKQEALKTATDQRSRLDGTTKGVDGGVASKLIPRLHGDKNSAPIEGRFSINLLPFKALAEFAVTPQKTEEHAGKTVDQIMSEGIAKLSVEERRDFYAMANAIVEAVEEFATTKVDKMYAAALRDLDPDIAEDYDQEAVIEASLDLVQTEDKVVKRRVAEARKALEQSRFDHSVDAMTMLTDPRKFVSFSKKGTAKHLFMNLSDNAKARREQIGRFYKEKDANGDPLTIVLAPVSGIEMIRRHWGKKIPKQKFKDQFATLVENYSKTVVDPNKVSSPEAAYVASAMLASPMAQNAASKLAQDAVSYFNLLDKTIVTNGVSSLVKDKLFAKNDFGFTKDEADLTNEEAATLFANKFQSELESFITKEAQHNNPKAQLDFSDPIVKSKIDAGKLLVKNLVASYGMDLSVNTRQLVKELLEKISNGTMSEFNFDSGKPILVQEFPIMLIDVKKVAAEVFSEIEGKQITEVLISGLIGFKAPMGRGAWNDIVSGWFDKLPDFAAWWWKIGGYTQNDIRAAFGKKKKGLDTARYLEALLSHGFDSNSGRSGYERQLRATEQAIGAASLGLSDPGQLERSIGVVLAQIYGIQHRFGMSKMEAFREWYNVYAQGVADHKAYIREVNDYYNASFAGGFLKVMAHPRHDIAESSALLHEIGRIIRGGDSSWLHSAMQDYEQRERSGQVTNTDQYSETLAQSLIDRLEENLKAGAKNAKEVETFAHRIVEIFRPINLAAHVELAMDSRLGKDEPEMKWKEERLSPFHPSYSVVPVNTTTALMPKSDDLGAMEVDPSSFVSDPGDLVSINQLRIFGKRRRRFKDKNKKQEVVQPIVIDGIKSLMSSAEDTIYRTNVAPTMLMLRRMLGSTKWEGTFATRVKTSDSLIFDKFNEELDRSQALTPKEKRAKRIQADMSIARVSWVIDKIVRNDRKQSHIDHRLGKIVNVLSMAQTGLKLISPTQYWNQSIPPLIGYSIANLLRNNPGEYSMFISAYRRSLTEIFSLQNTKLNSEKNSTLSNLMAEFVRKSDESIYYRGLEGIDQKRKAIAKEKRFTENSSTGEKAGFVVDDTLDVIHSIAEGGLSYTIGATERLMARTQYCAIVASKLGLSSIDELLAKKDPIPVHVKEYARRRIVDFLAEHDQSKKPFYFNWNTKSAVLNNLLNWAARFSNHLASTSSGVAATAPALWATVWDLFGGKSGFDKEVKLEAWEMFTQTILQNGLFNPLKPGNMVFWFFLANLLLFGDDDDKEAPLTTTQQKVDEFLYPEDAGWFRKLLTITVLGKQRRTVIQGKSEKASRRSLYAEIAADFFIEAFAVVRGLQLLARTSLTRDVAKGFFLDDLTEILFAMEFGDDEVLASSEKIGKKEAPWSRAVAIRDYEGTVWERLATPLPVVEMFADRYKGIGLGIKAMKEENEGSVKPSDLYMHWASQVIPYREWKQYGQEMKKQLPP